MGTVSPKLSNETVESVLKEAPTDDPAVLASRIETLELQRRQLDAEVARLNALASLGEGVATIAHEIRNPLGAIAGYADLLTRRCASQPELGELSKKILGSAQSLNSLVERLLDLVRNAPMDIRTIEWPRFLEYTVDQYEDHARQRGVRLKLVRRWSEHLGDGRADALCLRQAVWNVLENAHQASSEDGEIEIDGVCLPGGFVKLIIADRGPGIASDILPKLFTPFVTTRAGGTGLGLATARKIVEAHGGRICIRNRDGGGAEVEMYLPAPAGESLPLADREDR